MKDNTSRSYRKRKRAESEEETRRRITEAAVELHGTVGPAKTTVTEVAKLAGVSRMTVYNHFPTEVALFNACSTHWATQNPFPDPTDWAEILDPATRLARALRDMYGWYALKQGMLGNVLRDVAIVPALAEVMDQLWSTYMLDLVRVLAQGWSLDQADDGALPTMIRLAVDFNTWQLLTGEGLDHESAAELMTRMVTGASD